MNEAPNEEIAAAGRSGEGLLTDQTAPPEAPKLIPPTAQMDYLEAIRSAVVDAAGVSVGLWLSYLFVLFYLLVVRARLPTATCSSPTRSGCPS